MGLFVFAEKPVLIDSAGFKDLADMIFQLGIVAHTRQFWQRTAKVSGPEVEQLCCRGRKVANNQIAIEKDRRNLCGIKEVAQVGIGVIKLLNLAVQLCVDGVQLFVEGLHLLLRGFKFLIGGLRLFVDRDQFFIRRFQLF